MKSVDLFSMLNTLPDAWIQEAEGPMVRQKSVRGRKTIRFLLIAALVACLGATAYAAIARNLNWTPEQQEALQPYQETVYIGVASKNWDVYDVVVELSAELKDDGNLNITANPWSTKTGEDTYGENTEKALEAGEEYWLEKWDGEAFQEMKTLSEAPWQVSRQSIPAGEKTSWTVDPVRMYGQLEPGIYRVGMMLNTPEAPENTMGVYAKFVVFSDDIQGYLDDFENALTRLKAKQTLHIRRESYYAMDDQDLTKDVWWDNGNFLERRCSYIHGLHQFQWDRAEMEWNGQRYSLSWGSEEMDGPPAEMETVYYDASDCVELALSVTESFLYRTEQAAADGDTVIFRQGPFEFWGGVREGAELRVQYDAAGEIRKIDYISEQQTTTIEVVDETPEQIAGAIASVDIRTPPAFSYAEELEAIEAMGYEMQTQGFAGTQPQASPDRDAILKLAQREVAGKDFNVFTVSYDEETQMWKVECMYSSDSEPYEVIYLDSTGIPKLHAIRPLREDYSDESLPKPQQWRLLQ